MELLVGTSGYAYKEWKGEGLFYPPDLPDKRMLEYYAEHFRSVEINNTFYRMPSASLLDGWRDRTPQSFRLVLKASRRISHQARLDPEVCADAVGFLLEGAGRLGDKLGALLFQLPPFQKKDVERLEAFATLLPEGTPAAFEFRHASWFDDAVFEVLRRRNFALCFADGELKVEVPFQSTADWGYLRLRGLAYDDAALEGWATKVAEQGWQRAFVFFKHEEAATGPRLARRFLECAQP